MNKVELIGNLTKDPDIRYAQNDQEMAIARYTLAVNRRGRKDAAAAGQQTADFIGCVAFRQQAEFAEKYFRKGMKVAITGRIQTGSYVNRDGQKVYTTDVIVEDQEFCESKGSQGAQGAGYAPYGAPAQNAAPMPNGAPAQGAGYVPYGAQSQGAGYASTDGLDDELPFN